MKFKIPAPDSTITFDDQDIFERSTFAQTLTKILSNTSDSLVISLEAKWGEGKTSFIHKWINRQRDQDSGIECFYIDAYKGDYSNDPFLFLASEIYAYSKTKIVNDADLLRRLKKGLVDVGGAVAKAGAKTAIQVATLGLVTDDSVKAFSKNISSEIQKVSDSYIESILETHTSRKNEMDKLAKTLTSISEHLSTKQFVIVIDELDRCRPIFALELLETIKHLFTAPKVSFIIINNQDQLEESVRTQYGNGGDSGAYLRKFFDLSLKLPHGINHEVTEDNICRFSRELLLKMGEDHFDSLDEIAEFLACLFQILNLTLRDIEKIVITILLMRSTMGFPQGIPPSIVCGVASMFVLDRNLLLRLAKGDIEEETLRDFFNFNTPHDGLDGLNTFRNNWYAFAVRNHRPNKGNPENVEIFNNKEQIKSQSISKLLNINI
jgi:hypothetical protein